MAKKEFLPAVNPDPLARFEASKAAFEVAKKKTIASEGSAPTATAKPAASPKPAPTGANFVEAKPPPEKAATPPQAEKPAAPAPKPKVEKPAPQEPSAIEKKLEALSARLEAALAPKASEPEPEDDDPFEGVRAKLSERFGEDEAGALVEALESLHAPAAKRIAHLESILQEATKSGRASISKANQKRLSATHPQLENADAWKVIDSAVTSAFEKNPKAYGSAEEGYDAIATALYGEPKAAEPESNEDDEAEELVASRIASAAMTAPAKAARAEPRSRIEKTREVFNYLKKHPDDKHGAKRLARELRVDR